MKRETTMRIIGFLVKKLVILKVSGAENVPEKGAYLVTTAHISRLDTPFLMLSTDRTDVIGLIARDYQRFPFMKWIINGIKAIWITRGAYDFEAFHETLDYLSKGWIVGIAPEGTRSKTQELQEGKSGAALLADRAGVQVIPAVVNGSADMVKQFSHLRRMRVNVIFGKPFDLPPKDGKDNKDWLLEATDEIMCQIAALLPESRRGFYKDHPRLKEILNQKPGLPQREMP